ncbi:MAG: ion transporter [Candidatus Eiseniibacteriota bacterium]
MKSNRWRRLADHPRFQTAIVVVILANAVVLGLETSQSLTEAYGAFFHGANLAFQAIYVAEIAIRIAAHWPRPATFFRDGWNVFDFTVVAISLLPVSGPFANVARLARVLRIGRLVSLFPDLRLIIGTMLRSIPSMIHVIALLCVFLYIYGILGVHLFGARDPDHWGSLPSAVWTLFKVLTLEGWIEIQQASGEPFPWTWLYFASFIFVAVFVVVNLFIAVVINNLDKVKAEQEVGATAAAALTEPQEALLARIGGLKRELESLEQTLRRTGPKASR